MNFFDQLKTDWKVTISAAILAISFAGIVLADEKYKPGDIFQDCDTCPSMIVVPSGSFMMGAPDDMQIKPVSALPRHRVKIDKMFAVGRFEITVGEFKAFINATNYAISDQCHVYQNLEKLILSKGSFYAPGFEQSEKHPAVCISWNDALEYVQWLKKKSGYNYRLLTEAEWEYVVRAGSDTPYWWGHDVSQEMSNYLDTVQRIDPSTGNEEKVIFRGHTVAVDSFKPNPFGLYNVHGNASEWVQDCAYADYKNAPADGSEMKTGEPHVLSKNIGGACTMRRIRGGNWAHSHLIMRSFFRSLERSDTRVSTTGLRVVRAL